MDLFKSETDVEHPIDSVQLRGNIKSITEAPEEIAIPHHFVLKPKAFDEEAWSFYSDSEAAKETVVDAIEVARGDP